MKYGKEQQDDTAARDRTCALVREFIARFTKRTGTVMGTGPTGCNVSDPGQQKQARKQAMFRIKCQKYVRDADRIAEHRVCPLHQNGGRDPFLKM